MVLLVIARPPEAAEAIPNWEGESCLATVRPGRAREVATPASGRLATTQGKWCAFTNC
ncbi:MAG: hypothetical protein RMM58_04195 [Chloroflexota bacterium]|nr:hypothetical protein [Chloroflexota bacterium]